MSDKKCHPRPFRDPCLWAAVRMWIYTRSAWTRGDLQSCGAKDTVTYTGQGASWSFLEQKQKREACWVVRFFSFQRGHLQPFSRHGFKN